MCLIAITQDSGEASSASVSPERGVAISETSSFARTCPFKSTCQHRYSRRSSWLRNQGAQPVRLSGSSPMWLAGALTYCRTTRRPAPAVQSESATDGTAKSCVGHPTHLHVRDWRRAGSQPTVVLLPRARELAADSTREVAVWLTRDEDRLTASQMRSNRSLISAPQSTLPASRKAQGGSELRPSIPSSSSRARRKLLTCRSPCMRMNRPSCPSSTMWLHAHRSATSLSSSVEVADHASFV